MAGGNSILYSAVYFDILWLLLYFMLIIWYQKECFTFVLMLRMSFQNYEKLELWPFMNLIIGFLYFEFFGTI